MFAWLLCASAACAAGFAGGGFESSTDLWARPSAWTTGWTSCNVGATTFPASGVFSCYGGTTPCGAQSPCNLNVNVGCGYVRVVDTYVVPFTLFSGGLSSTYAGSYACEMYSSRPSAACSATPQAAYVEQSAALAAQSGHVGACVQAFYAVALQVVGSNPGPNDAHFRLELRVNGNPYQSVVIYGNSPGVVPGDTDPENTPWRYLPWAPFQSGCLPFGATVTLRAEAISSDSMSASRHCVGYLDEASVVLCCPESPTRTVTATVTRTLTITDTPSISPTPTTTPSVSGTATVPPTPSATATTTQTFVGPATAKDVPYLRADRKVYHGAPGQLAYVQWIVDRDVRASIRLYNSAGEVIRLVWEGYTRKNHVDHARLPLVSPDGARRSLATGIYVLRMVSPGFVLSTRFAIVRDPSRDDSRPD